jgi:hypothetical protein
VEGEEKRGMKKIIARALMCPHGWHALLYNVKGDTPI